MVASTIEFLYDTLASRSGKGGMMLVGFKSQRSC